MLSTKSLTASQRLYAELKLDAPDPTNQTKAKQRSGKQASKTVGCSTLNLALADPGGRASQQASPLLWRESSQTTDLFYMHVYTYHLHFTGTIS